MDSVFKKEIYRLRLAITTSCVLRCKYCYVRKTNEKMSFRTAKKSIDYFLNTKGNKKIIIIYGGEPLLQFKNLKCIVSYIKNKSKKLGKEVTISLGTNGILLKLEHLKFFRDFKVKISLSLDGEFSTHDKNRIFKNNKGSFNAISRVLPKMFKIVPFENIGNLFAVHPANAHATFKNFIFLTKLGFQSINIEPILNIYWSPKELRSFLINLERIFDYTYNNIEKNKFVFLNSMNRELDKRLISNRPACPFYQDLEIYPSGSMAFSPFLINSKDKERFLIGNINQRINKKYLNCFLNTGNCRYCWDDYLDGYKQPYFCEALRYRNNLSIKMSNIITGLSKSNEIFNTYIKEAKRRIFE